MDTRQYHKNIQFRRVNPDDKALLQQIYRLRYRVYCNERGYLQEAACPDQMERDQFDPQSVQFAAIHTNGQIVGTVRLILPGQKQLPIEEHYPKTLGIRHENPHHKYAEISRLAINRDYCLEEEKAVFNRTDANRLTHHPKPSIQRYMHCITFGLIVKIYEECKQQNIHYLYAMMKKCFWLLLKMNGIVFMKMGEGTMIGPFGPAYPYMGQVPEMEKGLMKLVDA
jgi:N-acyl amino acid synthase of PEP-CTERM/exosortase system